METIAVRKPLQGTMNIIRFNWHLYVVATVVSSTSLIISLDSNNIYVNTIGICVSIAVTATAVISLAVSYYIYDYSDLYKLRWLRQFPVSTSGTIINIHAGFDETSELLRETYPSAHLFILDFYDRNKHTEVSIERARKVSKELSGTIRIDTERIPLASESAGLIVNFFALHEVRSRNERIGFLREQARVLEKDAVCVVVEHLRDLPNFVAYNIGYFHFLPLKEWLSCFSVAGLNVRQTFKMTPFISIFILTKN